MLESIFLTFKLAFISTLILLCVGIPLSWNFIQKKSIFNKIITAIISLPLFLPPTVMGFYLLIALGPQGPVGQLFTSLGVPTLAFSFGGLIFGSVIYSLPFVLYPLMNAFSTVDQKQQEAALTLGARPWQVFFYVVIPRCRKGILSAAILSFAHVVGEFGLVLMIGGNIPGKTRVLSIAIYDYVESLQYEKAHVLSLGLLLFSFLLIFTIHLLDEKKGG